VIKTRGRTRRGLIVFGQATLRIDGTLRRRILWQRRFCEALAHAAGPVFVL